MSQKKVPALLCSENRPRTERQSIKQRPFSCSLGAAGRHDDWHLFT